MVLRDKGIHDGLKDKVTFLRQKWGKEKCISGRRKHVQRNGHAIPHVFGEMKVVQHQ